MGLFSSIGKAFKSVVSPITDLFSGSSSNEISRLASGGVSLATGNPLPSIISTGSDLLNLGSSAYSLIDSLSGRSRSNNFADAYSLMQLQSNLQNEAFKTQYGQRHQLEVQDLRQAGLNPLLSVNSAGSIGATSLSSHVPETGAQRIANAINAAQLASNIKLNNSAIATQQSQQVLNNAIASFNADNGRARLIESMASLQNAKSNFIKSSASSALDLQMAENARKFPANVSEFGRNINVIRNLLNEFFPSRNSSHVPYFGEFKFPSTKFPKFNPAYGTGD